MSLIIKVTRNLLIKKLVRIRLVQASRVSLHTLNSTWTEGRFGFRKNWDSAAMRLETPAHKRLDGYFLGWHCEVSD